MNDESVRSIVVAALYAVTDNAELVGRLQDPDLNMRIADLGIDSLDAIEWCMEIETRTGLEIDPAELITHASVDDLVGLLVARRARADRSPAAPTFVRVPRDPPPPLSFGQERIWSYSQTPQGAMAYTLRMTDHLVGPLAVDVLRDCLDYIVRRHEILRTTFALVDGEPAQIIHPPQPIELPVFQLSPGADPKEALAKIVKAERARVLDLRQGPLMRFSLIKLRENEHWLLRICHHILWDSWSSKVLLSELAVLYNAAIRGAAPPLPEFEPLQYADYAVWQRKALCREAPAYCDALVWWKERFRRPPPPLDLPFRRPAPLTDMDPAQGVFVSAVDAQLARRLAKLARAQGVTIYTLWLAALVALLAAETARQDIVVGTYVTNRQRPEVQNMLGYFANLIALRFECDDRKPFVEWLSEVRFWSKAAEGHAEIPHEQLRRDLEGLGVMIPEIRLIFVSPMGYRRSDMEFADLKLARPDVSTLPAMPWGFTIDLDELHGAQRCRASFDANLYDPGKVRPFIGRLHALLDAISRRPELAVDQLLILPETACG